MAEFMNGLALCENFFFEAAKPLLNQYDKNLQYTAGLIGYGSDMLGYDTAVSTDHMWGPRFYLFLREEDFSRSGEIYQAFAQGLPYTFMGHSVNFSKPDEKDNGVHHPVFINEGEVSPLIFIHTIQEFINGYLGIAHLEAADHLDWLTFSEHRLLGFTEPVDFSIESYYGRDIQVIFADKFSEAVKKQLRRTPFENMLLIGTLSQVGNFTAISDDQKFNPQKKALYQGY